MTATLKGSRWGLTLLAGSFGLMALLLAHAPNAPAQVKKSDPKKVETGKKTAEPKEAKVNDVFVTTGGGQEQLRYLNEMIEEKWKENKITPSERCSDYEFIRRASLDIIGRIAKIEEIEKFLKDPPERRRSLLIERLLASDEYAQNWANMWTVLLLTRAGVPKTYQLQMHEWLVDQFKSNQADWSKIATDLVAAEGETNKNGAVNFVLAHLGDQIKADPQTNGKYEMVPLTSRSTRLFLGLRTQCVQCHDHPFNGEWKQEHFWGINAFFRQVDTNGRPTMMNKKKNKGENVQVYNVTDNRNLNSKGVVPYERRAGTLYYTSPTFLDGTAMDENLPTSTTRRKELAKFIVKSPYFAKTFVNRTWGHFFGRSFTKDAVDDFGEHNAVSHPELLEKLSDDWAKKYNHNPKDLIRWICNSRAYGLSSAANKGNDKPEDEAFFARMLLKPMTPEQMFDSLMTATEAKIGQDLEDRKALKEAWLEKLVVNFGDDEGNEGTYNGTVIQALMLMNGKDINDAITDSKNGTAAFVIRKYAASPTARKDALKHLYLAALNRPPRADEYARILDPKTLNFTRGAPPKDQLAYWTNVYQDIFWAILNSNEFILNH